MTRAKLRLHDNAGKLLIFTTKGEMSKDTEILMPTEGGVVVTRDPNASIDYDFIATEAQTSFILPEALTMYNYLNAVTVNNVRIDTYTFDDETSTVTITEPVLVEDDLIKITVTDKDDIDANTVTTNELYLNSLDGKDKINMRDIATFVKKPVITMPEDGAVDYSGEAIVSPFETIDKFLGGHNSSVWELATDSEFANIVTTSTEGNLTVLPLTSIDALTTYYLRVKFVSDSHTSEWSEPVSFKTPDIFVLTPDLMYGQDEVGMLYTPVLETSPFEIFNGNDTHVSTDWQIIKTSNDSLVYESIGDTENLIKIEPPILLELETEYKLRVKHNGLVYNSSAWQEVIATTTNVAILKPEAYVPSAVNELSLNSCSITNYLSENTYMITALKGTIYNQVGSSFSYQAPDVDEDGYDTITVVAMKDGMSSAPAEYEIEIRYVPIEFDETIQVVNFPDQAIVNTGFIVE